MASETARLSALRRNYSRASLDEKDVARDPIEQFQRWFEEARKVEDVEPNAMTLATVDAKGHPNARIVLLKGVSDGGFTFFTNYESDKGRELTKHKNAALVFHWPGLERQVRIRGKVKRVSRAASREYFESRPRQSQLGALASAQSEAIASRKVLERSFASLEKRYAGLTVPLPDFWGGFLLVPVAIEFWQGRPSRLHDRIRYRWEKTKWVRERLAP